MGIKKWLYNKNPLLTLSYLSKNINDRGVYGKKIAEEIGVNQGSVSMLLKQFKDIGLLESESIGKTILYKVDEENVVLKAFRVFENLVELAPLICMIKPYSRKIILYGSCSKGEDMSSSDIDIFIVADKDNQELIREEISGYEIDRIINPVIVDTLELMEMEDNDKVFIEEVYLGIDLGGSGSNE